MNFAYYCSGHGYGHATRVSALAGHLLQLPEPKPTVHIISSAPTHVFADSIRLGAKYRNAHVDPVIQQPVAYRVDRKKSIEVLNAFLNNREALIAEEVEWMKRNNIHCVLSDAVFIACAAANRANLPSALITNFTFDSIWSYLSAPVIESTNPPANPIDGLAPTTTPQIELEPDEPIAHEVIDPLANQIAEDYRNADLLLRLPGFLPFPSFSPTHPLPAPDWIDPMIQRFYPNVLGKLQEPIEDMDLYPSIPFQAGAPAKPFGRIAKDAPLLVRHPAPDIYTTEARQRVLDGIGVPRELQDAKTTKILIVSFGGQVIRRPTHSRSRNGSRNLSWSGTPLVKPAETKDNIKTLELSPPLLKIPGASDGERLPTASLLTPSNSPPRSEKVGKLALDLEELPTVATPSHLYIPGAPPASNPASPLTATRPTFGLNLETMIREDIEDEPRLLPDGWIAIVCGVSKGWGGEDLPEGFYIAPRDTYMPDLTAIGDVLLGKLGYGTCAECVDACTPFVYVPRPLIVEEHGLRVLMENQGVGVLLSQDRYEAGDWAAMIEEAYEKGKFMKAMKRNAGWDDSRKKQADIMARELVDWLGRCVFNPPSLNLRK
ncbi:hypothetical protein FRC03_007960 [Tulasnella sp. 419]|nr:hypothetical protein FRC03_007960 [Tulasnella sp. 419]